MAKAGLQKSDAKRVIRDREPIRADKKIDKRRASRARLRGARSAATRDLVPLGRENSGRRRIEK